MSSDDTEQWMLKVRRILSEQGWLSPVRTVLESPVSLSEMECPDCESDDLVQYEIQSTTIVECTQCGETLNIDPADLIHDRYTDTDT